jgi:acetyl-CoA C-acetyltransferase
MGCVLPAGQGQAPARQAGFAAGLGEQVPATTVNKMCGSGMKAAMIAFDQIALGRLGDRRRGRHGKHDARALPPAQDARRRAPRPCAGRRPHVPRRARGRLRPGRLMGTFAEDCAEAFQFTRADQDAYALRSLENALARSARAPSRRDRACHRHHPQGRHAVTEDEQPEVRPPRQDPDPQARLPQGRHGHARQFLVHLRRRGGADPVLRRACEAHGLAPRAASSAMPPTPRRPACSPRPRFPAARKLLDRLGWRPTTSISGR